MKNRGLKKGQGRPQTKRSGQEYTKSPIQKKRAKRGKNDKDSTNKWASKSHKKVKTKGGRNDQGEGINKKASD